MLSFACNINAVTSMYIHCHYRVQFGRELEVSGYSSRVEQDIASFLVKKLIILICSEMTLILLYI